MRIRSPRPASLSVVCLEKIISTPSGEDQGRYGTGFLVRGANDLPWLVTSWHVLTGRRPDKPGVLLGNAPQSPRAISISFPASERSRFLPPVKYMLYQDDQPIWSEHKREQGIDIAAFPVELPPEAAGILMSDFAPPSSRTMEPGINLIVVGFPFKQGPDVPYPIWKKAMLASEPGYTQFGDPQMLLDTPGTPGMSGSPVFRSSPAFATDSATMEAMKAHRAGELSALDLVSNLNPEHLADETVGLELVGIYAGSTGDPALERLQLGRMYPTSAIDLIVHGRGSVGSNPYPPTAFNSVD